MPLMFGVRRILIRVTGGNCTLPAIRIGQPTPLAARRQRLIHTNPRSATCAIYSAGFPPQCLVKLQFQHRLCAQIRMLDQVHTTPTDSAQARRCDCRGRARLAKQTGLHATCRRLSIIHAGHMQKILCSRTKIWNTNYYDANHCSANAACARV